MSDIVIHAEGLGKKYLIGHEDSAARVTLRDSISRAFRRSTRGLRDLAAGNALTAGDSIEEFWALRDIEFELRRGEVLGIIGRNGAGKSTLLKILSRITEPSSGRVHLIGRVASLLEVGTGFHGELSGRENIFLNGSILGMSRSEIRSKFDEIVAFAEVEKFLDTPVKRYSSGMYVRLAFAVAAHLDPDILIVDEVLAVGDAEFQRKCLGKIREVADAHGRTVIFVSHNIAAIHTLCTQVMYLKGGTLESIGDPDREIAQYSRDLSSTATIGQIGCKQLSPSVALESISFGRELVRVGGRIRFSLELSSLDPCSTHDLSILVYTSYGTRVGVIDLHSAYRELTFGPGHNLVLGGWIRRLPLIEGDYSVGLRINCPGVRGDFFDLCMFSVFGHPTSTGTAPRSVHDRGYVEFECEFDASATVTSNECAR